MIVAAVHSHTVSDFKVSNHRPSYTVYLIASTVFPGGHICPRTSQGKRSLSAYSNTLLQMCNSELNVTDLLTKCSKDQL